MRVVCLGLFIFSVATCNGCRQKAPASAAQDLDQLKGTWRVAAIEVGAKATPDETIRKLNLHYVFDGDQLSYSRPGSPHGTTQPVKFTLDVAVNPKRITWDQSPPARGIYSLEGNKLVICWMAEENAAAGYPTAFVSQASPKTELITLERQ